MAGTTVEDRGQVPTAFAGDARRQRHRHHRRRNHPRARRLEAPGHSRLSCPPCGRPAQADRIYEEFRRELCQRAMPATACAACRAPTEAIQRSARPRRQGRADHRLRSRHRDTAALDARLDARHRRRGRVRRRCAQRPAGAGPDPAGDETDAASTIRPGRQRRRHRARSRVGGARRRALEHRRAVGRARGARRSNGRLTRRIIQSVADLTS